MVGVLSHQSRIHPGSHYPFYPLPSPSKCLSRTWKTSKQYARNRQCKGGSRLPCALRVCGLSQTLWSACRRLPDHQREHRLEWFMSKCQPKARRVPPRWHQFKFLHSGPSSQHEHETQKERIRACQPGQEEQVKERYRCLRYGKHIRERHQEHERQ